MRSFHDGNADGCGDFPGLTAKLDYLKDLGVTTVWLLPFYPSPLKDDGYDIADYCAVHAQYGTLKDFQVFLREAHRRKLRVITELVLNHTSDQHIGGSIPSWSWGRFLTEGSFPHAPPLAGALEYHRADGERLALAAVHGWLPKAESGWEYTLRALVCRRRRARWLSAFSTWSPSFSSISIRCWHCGSAWRGFAATETMD